MKTPSIIRQLVTRIRVGSTALLGKVSAFRADPFRVDRDWGDFAKMTDAERKAEYNRLLEEAPMSARFRRLNQHIASRWVYMPNAETSRASINPHEKP